MSQVNLCELLSVIADASSRACQVIQNVHQKRSSPSSTSFEVQYKEDGDPRSALTEADLNAQSVIMCCIRSIYGSELTIIGEEDEDFETEEEILTKEEQIALFQKYNVTSLTQALERNLFGQRVMVDIHDVCLYIDPLDGTREFVEGRLNNVQCLIGITYKQLPIGGVIGLPFVQLTQQQQVTNVVCSLNLANVQILETALFEKKGFVGLDANAWLQYGTQTCQQDDDDAIRLYTGDSNRVHKKHSLEYIQEIAKEKNDNMKLCIEGGCGNKILSCAAYTCSSLNKNGICIIPPGTCSWDSASPSSVVFTAMKKFGLKAKITDMFGGELVYDSSGKIVKNDLGIFASCGPKAVEYHEVLVGKMRSDYVILESLLKKYWRRAGADASDKMKALQSQPQSLQRNKRGYVISCQELQDLVAEHTDVGNSQILEWACPTTNDGNIDLVWSPLDDETSKLLPLQVSLESLYS